MNYLTFLICLTTIVTLIYMVIKHPIIKISRYQFSSHWIVAITGAIILIITNLLPLPLVIDQITNGKINPFEIVILFISLTFISIVLDELGFFNYLATVIAKISGQSQIKFFTLLYILVGILTIFTSNDIVILTFTPFICIFCQKTKVNPLPYLIAEFVAANSFSTMLIISNPTNILLSVNFELSFLDFFKVMVLPTTMMVIAGYIIILRLFYRDLKKAFNYQDITIVTKINNKPLVIITVIDLLLCTIILSIASFINLKMWLITLAFSLILVIVLLLSNRLVLVKALSKAPYNIIPFLIGMYLIIIGLKLSGSLSIISNGIELFISNLKMILPSKLSNFIDTIIYGFVVVIGDNLVNNIPMSLATLKILENQEIICVYSAVIGSNIGAYLTPLGALAGGMWIKILRQYQVKMSFITFIKYGLILVPIIGLVGLITLGLIMG